MNSLYQTQIFRWIRIRGLKIDIFELISESKQPHKKN